MTIHLNGTPHVTDAATLADLLATLDLVPEVVATAVNGDFVPRTRRDTVHLGEGDRVEIISPRQGG